MEIAPRPDLRTPAVVVHYEKVNQTNEVTWATTETDAFPPTATGTELKAIVLTVELDGLRANYLEQRVEVDPITIDNAQWWKQHLPALSDIPIENIAVTNPTRSGEEDLPNELVQGNIAGWMNQEVEADTIRAKLSWEGADEHVVDREVSLRLTATDASTRTYRRLISSEAAEPTPVGVAQRLYQALNELQYEGEVELESEEAGATAYLGRVLNVTGLQPAWAAMRAQVQAVEEDLERGRTRIVFGPAQHLGAADLVERLRVNRRRRATRRIGTRTSGKPEEDSPTIEQPTHGRLESANVGPGRFQKITWVHPEDPPRTVVVDALDLPEGVTVTVKLREEDVCDSGELRKRMVVASEPYEPPEPPAP